MSLLFLFSRKTNVIFKTSRNITVNTFFKLSTASFGFVTKNRSIIIENTNSTQSIQIYNVVDTPHRTYVGEGRSDVSKRDQSVRKIRLPVNQFLYFTEFFQLSYNTFFTVFTSYFAHSRARWLTRSAKCCRHVYTQYSFSTCRLQLASVYCISCQYSAPFLLKIINLFILF